MPSGTKRTNSAMGIKQIPPQNVIRLLLCWTKFVNTTKTIHASTARLLGCNTTGEKPLEIRVGGLHIGRNETYLPFPQFHPSQRWPTAPINRPPSLNIEHLSILLIGLFFYWSHWWVNPLVPHPLHG